MEPAMLAQHAYALIARNKASNEYEDVRAKALQTPRELNPATPGQHAGALVARLEDTV